MLSDSSEDNGLTIYCVAPGYVPAKAVIEIRHEADMKRNWYEVWLSALSEMERYAWKLEKIATRELINHIQT